MPEWDKKRDGDKKRDRSAKRGSERARMEFGWRTQEV
jgi:hypothetical protein